MFYTIIVLLFGLWFTVTDNKLLASKLRWLFFIGLALFVTWKYITSISLLTFFPSIIFSLVGLSLLGAFMHVCKENKIVQWMVLCLGLYLSYVYSSKNSIFSELQNTIFSIEKEQVTQAQFDENGEIFIQLSPNEVTLIDDWLDAENSSLRRAFDVKEPSITELDDYYIINIPDSKNTAEFITSLSKNGFGSYVEANEMIPMEFPQKVDRSDVEDFKLTNDPSANLQWHLRHLDMGSYYTFFAGQAVKPTKRAKLYILDTGVDSSHEDLWSEENTTDRQGHGTHCAGVAASITNNKLGVASMVPSNEWATVHGIQVIGDVGFGTQEKIISGIIQAADRGADVISMSLGSITNQTREKAYNDAIKYANNKGAIIVVAAGNANMDAKRYSPANSKNVITVSSVNNRNEKSGFSNHVQNIELGVAAPGEKILSTTPSNTYTSFNGTSMSTPQVAGLITVMKALKPNLSTNEVYQILAQTGKDTNNTPLTGKLIQPLDVIKMVIK